MSTRSAVLLQCSTGSVRITERSFGVRLSDLDNFKLRIEATKIVRVRGDHSLLCATGADDDMSIDDVGGTGGRQQPPDAGGVHPVQGNDICVRLADQPGKPDLALGSADRLGQCSRGHGEPGPDLGGSGEEHDDRPIVPVDRYQASGVEGDPRGHAAAGLPLVPVPRIPSAQDRSSSVRAPPVRPKASASNAPHPATSSSETATACWTNPDTLAALPDATTRRMRSSCSSSRVTVPSSSPYRLLHTAPWSLQNGFRRDDGASTDRWLLLCQAHASASHKAPQWPLRTS